MIHTPGIKTYRKLHLVSMFFDLNLPSTPSNHQNLGFPRLSPARSSLEDPRLSSSIHPIYDSKIFTQPLVLFKFTLDNMQNIHLKNVSYAMFTKLLEIVILNRILLFEGTLKTYICANLHGEVRFKKKV